MPAPSNPARTVPADIDDNPDTIPIPGAFVASSSSSSTSDATRSQVVTAKSLYLTDPDVDVQIGDRIRWGSSIGWVRVKPEADVNPFTGWQPVLEIPLEEVLG